MTKEEVGAIWDLLHPNSQLEHMRMPDKCVSNNVNVPTDMLDKMAVVKERYLVLT